MNILLIGGTGLLSGKVLNLCVSNGYCTYILNRGHNNKSVEKQVNILIADFYKVKSVEDAVKGLTFDIVVDFLSRRPEDINRIFPVFKNKCKQYVFISSACVYRRLKEDVFMTEDCPKPNFDWSYSIEKYDCEQSLINLSKSAEVKYTIVRPYITYDDTRIPFGITPLYGYHGTIIGRIIAGKPIFIWDKGEATTTLTRVEDFAKGIVGLFGNEKAYDEDFHIVTQETHTWKEFLDLMFLLLNTKVNIVDIPTEYIISQLPEYKGILIGDRAIDACFDNSKILFAVKGLEFSFSLKEGLKKTIDYYKENNYLKGIDYKWDAKIDRLISKYSSQKISFTDYLGNANKKDRITYFIYRNFSMRIANKLFSLIRKIGML